MKKVAVDENLIETTQTAVIQDDRGLLSRLPEHTERPTATPYASQTPAPSPRGIIAQSSTPQLTLLTNTTANPQTHNTPAS